MEMTATDPGHQLPSLLSQTEVDIPLHDLLHGVAALSEVSSIYLHTSSHRCLLILQYFIQMEEYLYNFPHGGANDWHYSFHL